MEWFEYPAEVGLKFDEYFKTIHERLGWPSVYSKYFRKSEIRKVNGAAYVLCPFHQDKTPSLRFSFAHDIFLCFGCGCGGDIFSFIKRMEGGSFEAMLFIRKYFQIPLPFSRKEWRAIKREIRMRQFQNINLYLQKVAMEDYEETFQINEWESLCLKRNRNKKPNSR